MARATLPECGPVPGGKQNIAVDVESDLCQHQRVGQRQRRRKDLAASDHEYVLRVVREAESLVERAGPLDAVDRPFRIPRDDDIAPARQRPEALRK